MDYETYFGDRLAQLRMKAGVSARDMSLSMGQSQGYINKIESHQNFPSMMGFFYICDYLKITPDQFVEAGSDDPRRTTELLQKLQKLSEKQLSAIETTIDAMLNS